MENYYILEIKDSQEKIHFGLLVFDDYNKLLKAKSLIEKFTMEWNSDLSEWGFTEDLYQFLNENGYNKNLGAIFKVEV